ncbi:MAG: hypothetical protein RJB65_440 [Actinomycetota bacterium]
MHDDSVLVERRIRRELMQRLMPAMYRATVPMTVRAWDTPGEPVAYADAMAGLAAEGRPFDVGTHWSRPWGTTWFEFRVDVPAAWAGSSLEAVVDLGFHPDSAGFQSEGLVWLPGADGRGAPLQGIHPRRTAVPLPDTPTGPLTLVVEAASNPAFPQDGRRSPLGSLLTAGTAPLYRLRHAHLGLRDDEVFHLLLDIEVLLGLMTALPAADKQRQRLLRELERAFDVIATSTDVSSGAPRARALLAPALQRHARDGAHHVIGVGHAHIDSAWLWPLRETVRKCARTFASATRMMDTYPEYRFVCSQAVQYQWMEDRYPALFERIRERVASGQWQPVGGMWVEADMNLPSGESIVRQLVHGQRYFESRFGVRCAEVWIPDVFGYPASMPQIYRAGGCERFVTQKLSWNKQNRFPHSTFWWEGLDGSRVLTHFPPVDTYNATVVGEEMVFSERNFKEHGWSDWSLMPYGHGNGGGGPTREMIERGRRLADLDGAPRLTMGTTDEFFARLDEEVASGAPVPVWSGELYFEMHRGTLTSQSATKVGNRRCEGLLREAELMWATASSGAVPDDVAAELDALWKDLLLQQFHDIIPGSSIAWVYEDSEREHARIASACEVLIARAAEQAGCAPLDEGTGAVVIANSATDARREVWSAPAGLLDPAEQGTQLLHDGRVASLVEVPGSSLAAHETLPNTDQVVVTEHTFTNGFVSMAWNLDGDILSIIDIRAAREVLPVGRSLQFELAPDQPVEYDAWDVEEWTRVLGLPLGPARSVQIVDTGPLVATLRVERSFGASTLVEHVTMRAGSPRIDIALDIDWHEDEQLLSLMLPLDVTAREAACEIQFGHVMRPTHASNSWDAAKFEVCAHRWVDLSEPGFGVAVLNDGRYGHGVQDGGVRVSLLRAAKYPDPTQDHGRHHCTISVMPHAGGSEGLASVVREGERLNLPLRAVGRVASGADLPTAPLRLDAALEGSVQISAVKRADDGSGELVVRLYEALGARSPVTVRLPHRITHAARCNALEEELESLDTADGIVALTLTPFELVTLRLG